ncbi:MAG: hypothetical protein A2051_05605 [Desulfovibrionales bacterium GWA2_65_9]|nr:MAG: hypothetical protein A2051_05605 [Desulfovibrionales bacterium GWA2_65_9]
MKRILIFLMLLVPTSALAGLTYDISCENVTNILIIRDTDQYLKQHTPQGFVHIVTFFLNPLARDAFQKFVDASRQSQRSRDAEGAHPYVSLSITANGEPLQNDILEIRGYSGTKVCTFILLEEDALAAARSVCPALVPGEIIKVGKWE